MSTSTTMTGMNTRRIGASLCVLLAIGIGTVAGCGEGGSAVQGQGRMTVFTSILPQAYFVERIGGDRVDVQTLVTPGSSPATYEPTPRQMADLSKAKLFFRIGVPFENAFLPKLRGATDGLRIVDTRAGIALREMKTHHHHEAIAVLRGRRHRGAMALMRTGRSPWRLKVVHHSCSNSPVGLMRAGCLAVS